MSRPPSSGPGGRRCAPTLVDPPGSPLSQYRTPRAPPAPRDEPERTTQANRYASLVEGVGLEPRVDDAASGGQAVAAGRRRGPKSRLDLESYLAPCD